jgi:hypothetical protein
MFRYWSGTAWSAALSRDPNAAPPPGYASPSGFQPGNPAFGQSGYVPGQAYVAPPARKRSIGPWLLLAVGVVVVVLVGAFVIRGIAGAGGTGTTGTPGGQATTNPCPTNKGVASKVPHPNDGRVYGGRLSYPRLGSPWLPPREDTRLAFGRDVQYQFVTVESNYNGSGSDWGASVLVGELAAGDGFYSPEEGSKIVMKCIVGAYYGDAKVGRQDLIDKATTVDGKEAWLLESHLTFDIVGLDAKGELAIVLIVATSAESSSIFYASVPDNAKQYEAPARDAMAKLRVG